MKRKSDMILDASTAMDSHKDRHILVRPFYWLRQRFALFVWNTSERLFVRLPNAPMWFELALNMKPGKAIPPELQIDDDRLDE